jgi:NADH-quinone oxidoreductase subunit G
MTIDGIPVAIEGEKNLLSLIQKIGVKMPTFCYHSELSTYGACRMCMVEDEKGGLHAACSTPPREGMKIRTNTERLRKYRKVILELLLSNHCRDCTTCQNNTKCKLQDLAMRFNIENVRFVNTKPVPDVDDSSPCITIDRSKCILCGDCVRTCSEIQSVGAIDFMKRGSKMYVGTASGIPIRDSQCVGCGQCSAVCPTGAIVVKNDVKDVWKCLDDVNTKVTIQIAPAVRVGIGKELGITDGENVMGLIVAALRRMGFEEIYDTSTGADLTVMEESEELYKHIESKSPMPLFSSCCPAWVKFCEKKHPELLPYVSTCKSPMQMFASVMAEYNKNCDRKTVHVALMPCTAKKSEASRNEFANENGRNVDYVLTTQEFIQMAKEAGIIFSELQPEAVDMPFGTMAGAGIIFGTSGGVSEAVLRRLSDDKSGTGLLNIAYTGVRDKGGIKEADFSLNGRLLHLAMVSGLSNAEKIIDRIEGGEHFDFVEVMACPGGCVSGAGQPFASEKVKEDRALGLYKADKMSSIKRSEDNPLIKTLYSTLLNGKVHELLHVSYLK